MMDKILKILFVSLLIFTVIMIVIFCVMGSVPDELIRSVYGFCGGGELGCMAVIKAAKIIKEKKVEDL